MTKNFSMAAFMRNWFRYIVAAVFSAVCWVAGSAQEERVDSVRTDILSPAERREMEWAEAWERAKKADWEMVDSLSRLEGRDSVWVDSCARAARLIQSDEKKDTINVLDLVVSGDAKYETNKMLDEYVCTGNCFYPKNHSRNMITPIELKRMGGLSVADAVRFVSGVQLKDYGGVGGLKTVNVRSLGASNTNVSIDGFSVSNAQNGQVDLGKFSLDNLHCITADDVSFESSEFSARENVSATSVRMEYDWAGFGMYDRWTKNKTNASAGVKFGSFGLVSPSVKIFHKTSNGFKFWGDANLTKANGKYEFRYKRVSPSGETAYDTTAVRQNGDINALRIEARMQKVFYIKCCEPSHIRAHFYHYNSERGVPGAIVNNVWYNGERLAERTTFGTANLRLCLPKSNDIFVKAKVSNDWTHYRNTDPRMLMTDNVYNQNEAFLSTRYNKPIFRDGFILEFDPIYEVAYNTLSESFSARRLTNYYGLRAGSFIKRRLKIHQQILGQSVKDFSESGQGEKRINRWSPMAVVRFYYKAFRPSNVMAKAKISHRIPSFNDLYYTDFGNADLKPERCKQLIIGTYNYLKMWNFDLEAYHNKVENKIVAYPKWQQFRWTMLNLGEVEINGFDATIGKRWSPKKDTDFGLRATYTYQQAKDVSDMESGYYGNQIAYVPRHSGTILANGSWRKFSFNYSFVYTGERYSASENTVYNLLQPWYTHDLAMQFWHEAGSFRVNYSFEVLNLLNQSYDVVANYPMPGRNLRGGVKVVF